MRHLYLIYAATVLLVLGASQLFGWSFTSTEEAKNIPRSVRDNPGAYRTHYFLGGK